MRPLALACAALLLAAAPASAQVRKFGDWIAACDNARNCAAYSWNRGSYHAYMKIERQGAPSSDATLTLAIDSDTPVTFRVQTDTPQTSPFKAEPITDAVAHKDGHYRYSIEKLPQAISDFVRSTSRFDIVAVDPPPHDPGDPNIDNILLEGAHEALVWIDAQQKRTGTETAFIGRGKRSRETIPPQPALPVVTGAKRDHLALPERYPAEVLKRGNAACGKEQRDAEHKMTVRLTSDLLMYGFFCGFYSGSSSLNHAFLVAPEGKPKAAAKPRFVMAPQAAAHIKLGNHKLVKTKTAVFNPDFDAATLTLTSFFSLRSAGDCGEIVDWVWNGREFHVGEVRVMPECEGIPSSDWPAVYRTQIKQ